jgi:hypothetical protein
MKKGVKIEDYTEDTHFIAFYMNDYLIRIYTVPIGSMTDFDGWNFSIKDTLHKDKIVYKDTTKTGNPRVAAVNAIAVFLKDDFDNKS